VIDRLRRLPASAWHSATIDTPKRRQQKIVYVDETVRLRGYDGCVRQVAVDGLGREQPTLLLSNNEEETARNLIIRYASRNGIEDGLGQCVNFFHLNCLSSEVRLNVDVDTAMTVLAQGCCRWLGKQLKGHDKSSAKQLWLKLLEWEGRKPVSCRAFLIEPEVRARLQEVVEKTCAVARDKAFRHTFASETVAGNMGVARLLSAIPDLDGELLDGEIRFNRLPVASEFETFPPRQGQLTVVVVFDDLASGTEQRAPTAFSEGISPEAARSMGAHPLSASGFTFLGPGPV
jgi:hypothetical protein